MNTTKFEKMEVEKDIMTNHLQLNFDYSIFIRKMRDRIGELSYQVVARNNKNGNELPLREAKIPSQLKTKCNFVIRDITNIELKKIIERENNNFNELFEEFLLGNERTRRKKS